MISLLVHLKDYKKESVLAPLFKMLEASFELFVPLVMAAVIDVGIAQKDRPYIVKMCFVLIALGIIGLVCSITAQYFAAKAASGFATGVRHALFEHIQKFTFTEMDTLGTSTLITRMTSDINQVQSGVNLGTASVSPVSFYCIWCNDYGIYGRYKGRTGFCCHNSAFISRGIWNHAGHDAII